MRYLFIQWIYALQDVNFVISGGTAAVAAAAASLALTVIIGIHPSHSI